MNAESRIASPGVSSPAVADPRFRRMLGAKLCVDIAENALAYALLIVVVRRTGSGIHSTLFVIALTIPGVIFGLPAGAIADRLPKRPVLIVALALRIGLTLWLIRVHSNIWLIYGVTLAFFAVGQVFAPIWIAVLPRLVGIARLSRAHALLNLAQLGGQVAGVVLIAPILLKTLGDRAVLIVVALFLIGATVITARLGALSDGTRLIPGQGTAVREARTGILAGWQIITADAALFAATLQLAIVASLLRSLIVLFPFYTDQVLGIAPENAVYVAAPAAVGAALGLALAPALGVIGRSRLATIGFAILVGALACLGLVNLLRPLIAGPLHLGMTGLADRVGVPPIVTTAMLFAVPLGFGIALNLVAARTVLNERAPEEAQARVFATQSALATVVSLVPLLFVGVLTSVVGARPVMLLAAILAAVAPVWLTRRRTALAATPIEQRGGA
ncbi:MAG: MFS transporter [Thermomicrobia bacterium]|nr:MFS transporter [Thermomicrobia bacterium]MCA1723067.1 MFS transporter [Thermomicrobia bacterium]